MCIRDSTTTPTNSGTYLFLLEGVDDGAFAHVWVAHHTDADLLLVRVKLGELTNSIHDNSNDNNDDDVVGWDHKETEETKKHHLQVNIAENANGRQTKTEQRVASIRPQQ